MRPESQPWLRQAEADLQAAQDSLASGHYEWACFQAQQAAEKAFKAFLEERTGQHPASHTLYDPGGGSLLAECQQFEPDFSSLVRAAGLLRTHEKASRYPDGSTVMLSLNIAPVDHYQVTDAQACMSAAQSIVGFVKGLI